MSATDELRRLLDERGVEYETDDRNGLRETIWCGTVVFQLSPTAKMTMIVTPEQAIAATLGSEFNPDGLPVGLAISDDGNLLNWRGENYVKQNTLGSGTLTAEQVREAIEKRFDFDVWVPPERWQAIADELNAELGSGTCELIDTTSPANDDCWGSGQMKMKCSRCGKELAANVALYSINNQLPRNGRKYSCWECLTTEERLRHWKNKPKQVGE